MKDCYLSVSWPLITLELSIASLYYVTHFICHFPPLFQFAVSWGPYVLV